MKNKINYDKYHRQLGLLITDSLQKPMPSQRFWKYFKQSYISHETVYDLMTQPLLEEYLLSLYRPTYMVGTMNNKEVDTLKDLKLNNDVINLYRGTSKKVPLGSSYTFDVNRAIWFAKRFRSNQAMLTSVTMKTSDIDAIWLERDEQEVFMLPSIVRKKAIRVITNKLCVTTK